MIIDCSACEMFQSAHCQDCLVTAVLYPRQENLVIDAEEEQAIGHLQEAGLAPPLKFQRKAG